MIPQASAAATFAAVFVGLYVAHCVADHWVQTSHQSLTKGARGWRGSWACLKHVITYTITTALAVIVLTVLLHLPVTAAGIVAGQLISGLTHYWADRRFTLAWLARITGKTEFYQLGTPRDIAGIAHLPRGERAAVKFHRLTADGQLTDDTGPIDNPGIGTGGYALDQSFHYLWLLVAAVVTTVS